MDKQYGDMWTSITSSSGFMLSDFGRFLASIMSKKFRALRWWLKIGQRTHVSVPKGVLKKWKLMLKEFEMFRKTNLMVIDPKMRPRLKTIPCTRYLGFSHRTMVDNLQPPIFSVNPFRFKSVLELLDENVVQTHDTFNFIGEVVGKEDARDVVTSNGWETKRLVVVLQDTKNNRINCILFGNRVDQTVPMFQKEHNEPLILILQYFKVSRWKGNTSIQSNFELLKVHFNLPSKEVAEFREHLAAAGPMLSGRISQVDNDGALAGVDKLIKGRTTVHTIEEVSMFSKEGQPWIAVKFEALNVGINDWCYSACSGCKKKVDVRHGTSSDTKHYSKDTWERVDRYKIEVIATDDTRCINLLLWDDPLWKDSKRSEARKGEEDYPKTLNNMLDRKLLLRIHVKSSNINDGDPVYPVIKVIHDLEVIGKCTPIKGPILEIGTVDPGTTISLSTKNLSNAVNLINRKSTKEGCDNHASRDRNGFGPQSKAADSTTNEQ
ncbi:hypothetical protein PIB30_060725 [Stylosanthes scabra]|uniref:Uncharacterized protein n=1 Tax=Stylosanthes scabra TaxID=79078 RepID=A0ABU6ZJC0_9FABA|nr:hypothetical protein [Stylosanthes scabra]